MFWAACAVNPSARSAWATVSIRVGQVQAETGGSSWSGVGCALAGVAVNTSATAAVATVMTAMARCRRIAADMMFSSAGMRFWLVAVPRLPLRHGEADQ